ncbi:glutamate synthase [Candidatus Epulonipiscium fishelsonii]|uniref:Glutamate synthase n=1 Tax=Candidatus Epulonipiscium fishelsonii TaxID=77094 RepID=A0ACC8X916_9FIRM|nr:glutamate synthase [Epulopiscium sp. SCG-B11WGA-EpuloA1]ONI39925.1 glutamate synthase [Epulopiscium sp. SCG-B05WGA-EpuloA1]
MKIKVDLMHFQELNKLIKQTPDLFVELKNCIGQRYIASGLSEKEVVIEGTPGNALAAYLSGSTIRVYGNVQEATGDTMDEGLVYVYGSAGDATGYSMRGGKIFVRDDAGYRAGIHMKAYEDKIPKLVIGGKAGCFLGEYQAGGIIIVLGLGEDETPVGDFCATGMHGGKIYIRTNNPPEHLGEQILVNKVDNLDEINDLILEFCDVFDIPIERINQKPFYVLTPNSAHPYKKMYTHH